MESVMKEGCEHAVPIAAEVSTILQKKFSCRINDEMYEYHCKM